MSYVPREYPDIVRDLLTTLTGGTVNESLLVPEGVTLLEPFLLRDRPIRRISHMQGVVQVGSGDQTNDIDYRFTPADYELVSLSGEANEFDAIRFRPNGKVPKPNTILTVNYYPIETQELPVTDLNVGSVVRTLLETVAREMTMGYLSLDSVYRSAFLATAEGNALDKVVALVGVKRLPAGHPLVKVRFIRQSGGVGKISVPSGTAVVDQDGSRYLTLNELTLEPGETNRDVLCGGESIATKLVKTGELNRLEVLIAGISDVINPEDARQQSSPENDDALRRRTRTALSGAVRGTVSALEFAVNSIEGVRSASVIEFPNQLAGEIKLEVAYDSDSEDVKDKVVERVEEYRPAGIRVVVGEAMSTEVRVNVDLTLAGAKVADAKINTIKETVISTLTNHLEGLASGEAVRAAKLTSLVMQDEQIADASITLTPDLISQPASSVLEVADVAFAAVNYEIDQGVSPASTAQVTVELPILLVAGAQNDTVVNGLQMSIDTFIATQSSSSPLTVAGLLEHVRDENAFAAIRDKVLITVENAQGQFTQLGDGLGSYTVSDNESLNISTTNIDIQGEV